MRLAESSKKGPPRHSIEKENRVSSYRRPSLLSLSKREIAEKREGCRRSLTTRIDTWRQPLEKVRIAARNGGTARREEELKIEKKTTTTTFFDSSPGKRTLPCYDQTRARVYHSRLYAHRDHSSHQLALSLPSANLFQFLPVCADRPMRFYIFKDVRIYHTFCSIPKVLYFI